jgi:hypothetical protein
MVWRLAFGVHMGFTVRALPNCEEGGVRYITHYAMSGRIYATAVKRYDGRHVSDGVGVGVLESGARVWFCDEWQSQIDRVVTSSGVWRSEIKRYGQKVFLSVARGACRLACYRRSLP